MKTLEKIKRSFKKWARNDDVSQQEIHFQEWAMNNCSETNHGENINKCRLADISLAYHAGYKACHRSMSRK